MKMDKTGACTVIAAIATVVAPRARHCRCWRSRRRSRTCPAATATRPGDIVRALNGKWVDIINTDAEGRLILGDAMTYAEQLGATHLVDVATLTGAVGRALGNLVTGAFATPDPWWDEVDGGGRARRRALLALPAGRGLHARDGELVRRLPEHRHRRGLARARAACSSTRVPDGAVGPPRHRRHRATSARRSRTRRAAPTGVTHATLVELALAGTGLTLGPLAGARRPVDSPGADAARGSLLALVGGAWGLAADRIAARWPAHDDGLGRARSTGGRRSSRSWARVALGGARPCASRSPVPARRLRRLRSWRWSCCSPRTSTSGCCPT